jgi:hypothetical protein
MMVTAFWCAVTQGDQDKVDEDDEREAMQNLVQTWLERLQLISVIVSKAMFYQAPPAHIFRQHFLPRLNRAC